MTIFPFKCASCSVGLCCRFRSILPISFRVTCICGTGAIIRLSQWRWWRILVNHPQPQSYRLFINSFRPSDAYICVSKWTLIGSYDGLSPGQRQAIILTDAGILSIGPLGTYFGEILIEMYVFSFKKIHLKLPSGNWRPFCLGLNVLTL